MKGYESSENSGVSRRDEEEIDQTTSDSGSEDNEALYEKFAEAKDQVMLWLESMEEGRDNEVIRH